MILSKKKIIIFLTIFIFALIIDQYSKTLFVNGFIKYFDCMSFSIVYNKGIAFSMFAFLEEKVKYIQISMLIGLFIYLVYEKLLLKQNYISWSLILAGGVGNIIDRFHYIGVVDFIHFHCGFNFAIFNFADIFINIGAFLLALSFFQEYLKEKKQNAK
jgi:signal peptidase II